MDYKEILKNLSDSPGVYIMRDQDREVLYVGKAKNLKKRVASYFRRDLPSAWIKIMVSLIDDIETIVVKNEFEALLLENNLIKKYHPKYNILLKDDKTFPYLKLTNEEFPRILTTRKVINDKARYFGPYLSVYSLRQAIQFIRKNFGIVTHPYKVGQRACLNYQIGLCSAPYAGKISNEEYDERVRATIKFLKGDFKELIAELENKMNKLAKGEDFEAAAIVRDQITNLNRMVENQNIVSTKQVNQDIIGVYKIYGIGSCTIMKVRQGKLLGSTTLNFDKVEDFDESDILQAVLSQHYIYNMDIPQEILVGTMSKSENVNEYILSINLLEQAFLERGIRTKIVLPTMGEKRHLVDLAVDNAVNNTNQVLSKTKLSADILDSLKKDLGMQKLPSRIEAFDISNLGTSSAVGAMVTFINGVPYKDHYRKFIIKTVEGQNDFAMMAEVIRRRLKFSTRSTIAQGRLSSNNKMPLPDLMLIDGGKGQLGMVSKVLKDMKLKIAVIGLAKKYELIYKPGQDLPIALDFDSKSLLLLRSIRDEVHRFVITFHRARRGKEFLK